MKEARHSQQVEESYDEDFLYKKVKDREKKKNKLVPAHKVWKEILSQ